MRHTETHLLRRTPRQQNRSTPVAIGPCVAATTSMCAHRRAAAVHMHRKGLSYSALCVLAHGC